MDWLIDYDDDDDDVDDDDNDDGDGGDDGDDGDDDDAVNFVVPYVQGNLGWLSHCNSQDPLKAPQWWLK